MGEQQRAIVKAVAVVVFGGLVVANCGGGSERPGGNGSLGSSPATETTQDIDVADESSQVVTAEGSAPPSSASVSLEGASSPSLVATGGSNVPSAVVSTVPLSSIGDLPSGFEPAGDGVDVLVPDGVVGEVLVLEVPGVAPPEGEMPVLLHQNDAGGWEADVATYDNGAYVALVTSFSVRVPGWISGAWDAGADWLSGRTDEPEGCAVEPYEWVASSGPPADGAFHLCLLANPDPADGEERVEVKIKSNRDVAMWIVTPSAERDYLWVEGAPEWEVLSEFFDWADGWLGQDAASPQRVLLPPGRTMTMGFRRPDFSVQLEYSSYQTLTTQLASVLYQRIGDLGILGTAVVIFSCLDSTVDVEGSGVPFGDMSLGDVVDCVASLGEIVQIGLESWLREAINEGRVALSEGALESFRRAVVESNRVAALGNALRVVGTGLQLADALADAASMLTDSLVAALVPGANLVTVQLTPDLGSVCDAAEISADMGGEVDIIDGLCFREWGYVEWSGVPGDAQFIVHRVDERWELYTAFPSFVCLLEAAAAGVPPAIHTRVGWMCEGETIATWDETYTDEPQTGSLRIGHRGERVEVLQRALRDQSFVLTADDVDGYFGRRTAAAVEIFQSSKGLEADGIAGPATLDALGLRSGSSEGAARGPAPGVACSVDAYVESNPAVIPPQDDLLGSDLECHEYWGALRLWVVNTLGEGDTCYESVVRWSSGRWEDTTAGGYCFTLCTGDYLESGMPRAVADNFATC